MSDTRNVNARQSQIGVMGDGSRIGSVHFHTPPPPIPLQRPARAEHFTDRENELARLLGDLKPGHVVTLCGPGGIGKTALAAEAAWILAPADEPPKTFPNGIVFYSFYGRPSIALAFEHIVRSFNETARDTSTDAALRVLSGKRALLILDGVEDARNLSALLEVRGDCGVLVTSRTRKDALANRQDIEPLAADDAVDLLRRWGGDRTADAEAATKICELVGHLPLAVRLVGRYLSETGETAAEYLAWLCKTPLDALDHGRRRLESVPVLVEKSLAYVSDKARQVLAVVGLLALAPFDSKPIASALGLSSRQLYKALGELVSHGLLLRSGENFRVSHALIHTYARRRMTVPEGVIGRLGGFFIRFVREHHEMTVQSYEKMDAVRPHIMGLLSQLFEHEVWEPVVEMAHLLTCSEQQSFLRVRGYWRDEYDCLAKAVHACGCLIREDDKDSQAYWSLRMADIRFALGDLLFYKDQYDRATKNLNESLGLYKQFETCELESARAMLKLGEIHFNRREHDQALGFFEGSQRVCEDAGGTGKLLAVIHMWLGRVHNRCEDFRRAQIYFEKSLAEYEDEEDAAECASVLIQLASLASDQGSDKKAQDYLTQSEDMLSTANADPRSIAAVRRSLANQYLYRQHFKRAEELHHQSLQDFEFWGDKRNIAWSLHGLGDTYFEIGDNRRAEALYQEALQSFQELEVLHGQAYVFDHLGQIALREGRFRAARQCFDSGLEAFRESGLRSGAGYILLHWGDLEAAKGQLREAIGYYEQSLAIWQDLGHRRNLLQTMEKLRVAERESA